MKIVSKLLTVAVLLFAVGASAQQFQGFKYTTLLNGGTNKLTAVTTNSYLSLDLPKSEKVCLIVNASHLNASGAGDVDAYNLQIFRGFEGRVYETNAWQTIVFPTGSSTAANCVVTNISVDSVPYLRCRFTNLSTNSHVTNLFFAYGYKN